MVQQENMSRYSPVDRTNKIIHPQYFGASCSPSKVYASKYPRAQHEKGSHRIEVRLMGLNI